MAKTPPISTNTEAAKPADKPHRLTDGGGLYLFVDDAGRYWRFDYRLVGKRKRLARGEFPNVSLAEARSAHAAATLVRQGTDPVTTSGAPPSRRSWRRTLRSAC